MLATREWKDVIRRLEQLECVAHAPADIEGVVSRIVRSRLGNLQDQVRNMAQNVEVRLTRLENQRDEVAEQARALLPELREVIREMRASGLLADPHKPHAFVADTSGDDVCGVCGEGRSQTLHDHEFVDDGLGSCKVCMGEDGDECHDIGPEERASVAVAKEGTATTEAHGDLYVDQDRLDMVYDRLVWSLGSPATDGWSRSVERAALRRYLSSMSADELHELTWGVKG